MPPPPPPPPPGPGPPGPPPPPMSAPAPKLGAMPDRKGLLGDIAKGKQLKKAVTNDRSAPVVAGGVVDSGSSGPKMGKPPGIPNSGTSRADEPTTAPQLGGLFAGGMPTLRKTNPSGRPTQHDTPNDVPKPPSMPPPVPGGPARLPPSAPIQRPRAVSSEPPVNTLATARVIPSTPAAQPPLPPTVPVVVSSPSRAAPTTSRIIEGNPAEKSSAAYSTHSNGPPPRPVNLPPSLPSAPPPPLPGNADTQFRSTIPLAGSSQPALPPPPPPPQPTITAVHMENPSTTTRYGNNQVASSALKLSNAHDSPFDGLQAALASRQSSSPRSSTISTQRPLGNEQDGQVDTSYSLKPQNIKRIDDSKYRFQPDTALPPIRGFTGSHKVYRSGRTAGNTVPLNLQALR